MDNYIFEILKDFGIVIIASIIVFLITRKTKIKKAKFGKDGLEFTSEDSFEKYKKYQGLKENIKKLALTETVDDYVIEIGSKIETVLIKMFDEILQSFANKFETKLADNDEAYREYALVLFKARIGVFKWIIETLRKNNFLEEAENPIQWDKFRLERLREGMSIAKEIISLHYRDNFPIRRREFLEKMEQEIILISRDRIYEECFNQVILPYAKERYEKIVNLKNVIELLEKEIFSE